MIKSRIDRWPLLSELVRKDLKVRYKKSALGFFWSLLNPLLMMIVFTLLFVVVLKQKPPPAPALGWTNDMYGSMASTPHRFGWLFPVYFLAGFLAWNFFAQTVQMNVGSIVGNAALVKKVYFPRELLPLSTVLAQGIHLALAFLLYLVAISVLGVGFWLYLPLFLYALVLVIALAFGVSLLFAAANVYFRDVQEFVPVLMLVWFYATPVFWSLQMLDGHPRLQLFAFVNPMTGIVQLFRDATYFLTWPGLGLLGWTTFACLATLALGLVIFKRLSRRFAEEI
jgi:lipopolysaccharide transport system permease protein